MKSYYSSSLKLLIDDWRYLSYDEIQRLYIIAMGKEQSGKVEVKLLCNMYMYRGPHVQYIATGTPWNPQIIIHHSIISSRME